MTIAESADVRGASAVSLKSLALPTEHGGWGMLLEPIVLALLLAPTRAGFALGVAALGAFLARHPLKLAIADWRRGTRYARTPIAERFALGYAALAAAAFAFALASGPIALLVPLALAAPLALAQLSYDARNKGRQLAPEVLGAVAISATSAAIALAASWPALVACALWAILALRAVASIVYVRARLRAARGLGLERGATFATHAVCLAVAAALAAARCAPWLGVVAFAMLFARAAHGLSPARPPVHPQAVGLGELAFGLLSIALLAAGYRLGV